MSEAILSSLLGISAKLASAGVPPLSDYWRAEAERFYTHPSARVLVECVGRGGDKSRTSAMMAVAEVLAGEFAVPAGERHHFVHVSENREEAAKTLSILEQYLKILGVPCTRAGDTIELDSAPRGFKVLACRIGAVSGPRCIGWTADEAAKWGDEGVDPTAEVIASIKGMTITHAGARGRIFSSPMGAAGTFYETWAAGDTDAQITGHAASWEANPSITEAQCHILFPDPREFNREARAIPQAGVSACFEAEWLDESHDPLLLPHDPQGSPVYVIDASDVSGNSNCEWAGGIATWLAPRITPESLYVWKTNVYPPGHPWEGRASGKCIATDASGNHIYSGVVETPPVLALTQVWGTRARGTTIDQLHNRIAVDCRRWGIQVATGDQYNALANIGGLANRGIRFARRPWNATNKQAAVAFLRRLFLDGRLLLDPHASEADWQILRRQLVNYEERIVGGGLQYKGRGLSDRASLLLVAALASLPTNDEESLFGYGDPLGTAKSKGFREVPIVSAYPKKTGTNR